MVFFGLAGSIVLEGPGGGCDEGDGKVMKEVTTEVFIMVNDCYRWLTIFRNRICCV